MWIGFAACLLGPADIANTTKADSTDCLERDSLEFPLSFLRTHCVACHNEEDRESGIRVDHLDGSVPESRIKLWEEIAEQIESGEMPPKKETQPGEVERNEMLHWIESALNEARSRQQPINGAVRRLTVEQYRNTLAELLGLEEDFASVLPPDGISRHGFTNDVSTLLTSPLQVEAWFEIAGKAIEAALVDETVPPAIQHFRMELGRGINSAPFGEALILGANSRLLSNQDFVVTEPELQKPFEFNPLRMRTRYRFNEGYQGNSTVRGWRDYSSIYHSVFACLRGDRGYPKGEAYQTIPEGLLLRPAIPTTEIFGESSTYGPKANFKIALRELPEFGRFRVTVKASRYDDGLLLTGRGIEPLASPIKSQTPNADDRAKVNDSRASGLDPVVGPSSGQVRLTLNNAEQRFQLQQEGVYQVDVISKSSDFQIEATPDASRLRERLIGYWSFDGEQPTESDDSSFETKHKGELAGEASFGKSPILPLDLSAELAPDTRNKARPDDSDASPPVDTVKGESGGNDVGNGAGPAVQGDVEFIDGDFTHRPRGADQDDASKAKSSAGDDDPNREPEGVGKENVEIKTLDTESKSLCLDGKDDSFVTPRGDLMNVGEGDFTVSAWIRPTQLRQGGIVCLGKYSWTHGWYFDMPNNQGVLRIETAGPNNQSNGTVASRPGVIRKDQWQHVAAVVQRGENQTHLYVNGYRVATGTINAANLDNPNVDLHIGRIQDSKLFKGQIDEVRIYRRALDESEIATLLLSGKPLLSPPPSRGPERIDLSIGDREFASSFRQGESAFLALRLQAGKQTLRVNDQRSLGSIDQLVLTRLDPDSPLYQEFEKFDQRQPGLGVYMGLRRDCGHTCQQIAQPRRVANRELTDYHFEGAINNYPRPFVQPDNDNYLAGVREITVRSEYTDGRDMPRLLIRSVEFEGPYYEQWPPESHQRILLPSKNADQPELYASEVLSAFATRAFRRPVNDRELAEFVDSWTVFYETTGDIRQSLKQALVVVLTSPSFLFTVERSETPEAEPLNDIELASKLSYFLWNGPPDFDTQQAASHGELRRQLSTQADRLIDDSRFSRFCDRFVGEWLSLDKFDVVETNRKKYPKLDLTTKRQLAREPARFVEHLFRENLPVRYLVDSPISVMNETVASYYGLGDQVESGFEFVPVEHQSDHLGGLLTQAALLAGLSDGREANPVKRGAWFARKLIAEPPDDPPPNVPELKDDRNLTLRERLEQHRSVKGCAKCHEGIDPWGLPFESFHAGGLYGGKQVDTSSTLPDGTTVNDFGQFRRYLVERRMESITFSLLKHLSIYAIGRSLTYNEDQALREHTKGIDCSNYCMRDALQYVIQSDLFLTK